MDVKERNEISANIKYLSECANIIYTKIRAIGSFYEQDSTNQDQMVINVEDYRHGTVSIIIKKDVMRICLDGTNYEVLFKKYKNGGFKFLNKELGIEYAYMDRKLDDTVHLKEIVRTVGNKIDYFKYTSIDSFICVLKYVSKNQDGWQSVERDIVDDMNIQELIQYTKQKMEDEYDPDIQNLDDLDYNDIEIPEVMAKIKEKENEEIRSRIEEYKGGDYSVIDFPLPDSFMYQIGDKPYSCVLPDKVQYYDEGEYIRRVLEEEKRAERLLSKEIHSCEKETEEDLSSKGDFELEEDFDSEEDFEQEEDLEYNEVPEYDGSDYNDENDSECEDYKVTHSPKDESVSEEDIIYMATAETLDIQMETEDICGFCEDIKNFAEKVKKIVYGRKKKLESQEDSFGDTNRRNQNNNTEFDKDI